MKNKVTKQLLFTLFCWVSVMQLNAQRAFVNGEWKKWHRIGINLELPTSIQESEATFRNNRMDVIVTRPDGSMLRIPGFFAANGNAANTHVKAGKIYTAYLRPDQVGRWTYRVLFYKGNGVASRDVSQLPNPTYNLTGTISWVSRSNKTGVDFRAKGRLEYQTSGWNIPRRYLRFAETGKRFLKFGPDSPENLLDYYEFDRDGAFNACGTKCFNHRYGPHAVDYKNGPTWSNGKGKNIIGVANYLSDVAKVNSISMSLFGGDDKNVYPWTTESKKYIYDTSKLAQWEIFFNHAEHKGLLLHFKLSESENWWPFALNNDQLRVYYREMVARFGHHLGIEWNIGEEFGAKSTVNVAEHVTPRVNFLASIDPYKSHAIIHTRPEPEAKLLFDRIIDAKVKLNGGSMQNERHGNYEEVFELTKHLVDKSRAGGRPWVVTSDEQAPANRGLFRFNPVTRWEVEEAARKYVIWNNLMAGGAGVMWFGGAEGDFRTENFRRFDVLHRWSRNAMEGFFQSKGVPFWTMWNADGLTSKAQNHCLANAGNHYVIYLPNGGNETLNLSGKSGQYRVRWFDPRNGGGLVNGITVAGNGRRNIGNPPNNATKDWVAYVTKVQSGSKDIVLEEANASKAVYPNPLTTNDSELKIDLEENTTSEIQIFNIEGKQVFEQLRASNQVAIDRTVFNASGVFVVNITTNGVTRTEVIIVE